MKSRGGGLQLPYNPLNRPPASHRLLLLTDEFDFVRAEIPSINDLIKHAQKFGTEFVVETAIELGYQFEAVCRLQRQIDVVARENYASAHKGMTGGYTAPRKGVEERVKKLMGIKEEDDAEPVAA